MKKTRRKNGEPGSTQKILLCTLTMPIFYLIFSLIAAAVCYSMNDPTSNVELVSMLSVVLAGGAGSFLISKADGKNMTLPIVSALIFTFLFLTLSLISNARITAASLMNAACIILTSAAFAFLGRIKRNGRYAKKHRI